MKKCNFRPYDGNEPYIFISYAHKDADTVYPILEDMHSRGYRIWYDDGIAPGSEWPENIAQHLNEAAVIMAFVSANSIASDNCRREITFALSKKKAFLSVMLEQTVLSPGMELQLSAQQCVMGYAYDSRDEFVDKLCQCPDLKPCLRKPDKLPIDPLATSAPNSPQPAERKQPENKESKPIPKSALIGIIVGAVLLVAIFLMFLLPKEPEVPPADTTLPTSQIDSSDNIDPDSTDNTDSNTGIVVIAPGVEFDIIDTNSVTLTDLTITAESVEQLRKLKNLRNLIFENCHIDVPLNLENDVLLKLQFTNCTGNQYLKELDGLTALYTLRISGGSLTDLDIPVLSLPHLSEFALTDNSGFTDLSKLVNCTELDVINVDNTGISDLSALTQISGIKEISANNCPISSIDCLASLEKLRSLSFNDCQISTVSEYYKSLRILSLSFQNNPLTDITGFDNLTILTEVNFGYTQLDKMACVEKSAASIQKANLAGCSSDIKHILENCMKMENLIVDDVPLDDCDAFAGMVDLRTLSASNCNIQSTSGLHNCTNLTELNLMNNRISDISFLSVLSDKNWLTIDLTMNNISDLSQLPSDAFFNALSVAKNPIDYSTFPVTDGYMLFLSYNETFNQDILPRDLYFSSIYILDCPDDKKVAIEDHLTCVITFTTYDELMS